MLYSILRFLFGYTFRIYYRNIHVEGKENIPASGPVLLCINHPSAFNDSILSATVMNRPVFFLAKGSVFKNGFSKFMLKKLNIIPVYRAQDDPTLMHKNQETFERCYEQLGKNGIVLITPEGISITERKLRPLKTGAARIAIGAEEKHGYQLGMKILPVGLNYEDPHSFRRKLFVNIGKPTDASAFFEQHKNEGFAAAQALTEAISSRMEELLLHIEDQKHDELVHAFTKMSTHHFVEMRGETKHDEPEEFERKKKFADALWEMEKTDVRGFENLLNETRTYFAKLKQNRISDHRVKSFAEKQKGFSTLLTEICFLVFFFPFFCYGLIFNALPFKAASRLSKNCKLPQFRGSIGAATGTLFFLAWYVALGINCWVVFHSWIILCDMLVSFPIAGMFAWFYFRSARYIFKRWKLAKLYRNNPQLVNEISAQRKNIMQRFNEVLEGSGAKRQRVRAA